MKVKLSGPVKELGGKAKGKQLIHYSRGTENFARAFGEPKGKASREQRIMRQLMGEASRAWTTLSDKQREEWDRYAYRFVPEVAEAGARGCGPGMVFFVRVQLSRLAMGWEVLKDAPRFGPPGKVKSLELAGGEQAPDEFRFVLRHDVRARTMRGMQVQFEITPAMPSRARKPRLIDYRKICGTKPESFTPLLESGGTYVFEGARFSVEEGQRFGVRVRLLSAEGVPGELVVGDFVR